MKLSEQALSICNENYAKNCGGCPIRTKCVANIGPGREAFEKRVNGVNESASTLTLF